MGKSVEITATQDESAALANLSRTATGKILRDPEMAGTLTCGYRSILLLREPLG